ncbi:MAG: SGNH/GDSL hydrolase family protein [Humibacter sp.]
MMITTPISSELLHGHEETEVTERGVRPHRLPAWVRTQFPDPQLLMMDTQPSGVRLAFLTEARVIEVDLHPTRLAYRGADRMRGSVDLLVDHVPVASDLLDGGDTIEVDLQTGQTAFHQGHPHTTRFAGLPAGEKLIELWLPHNESVELIELRTDSPVSAAPSSAPLWVHHGSSISHGSNAATPSQIWPAVAGRLGEVSLRNLGFGGSALVDPFRARVIRDSPADLISLKLGINVVNLDAMRLRAFVPAVHGFIATVRDGHPTTPIVLVSPIFCGIHEDTPGPGAFDPATLGTDHVTFTASGQTGDLANGRLTLRVIRDALASLVEHRADPNLHYLDGLSLYGPEDAVAHPLPDALHPDTESHGLIGRRFAERVFADEGPFGRAVRQELGDPA